MIIEAPFTIGVVDNQETGSRELPLSFTEQFRAELPQHRSEIFSQYVSKLQDNINNLDDDNPDKMGVMTIHQISSELLPHIIADELPLLDTIVVEIAQDALMVNLLDGVPIQ
jgi:hypothetical protein